VKEERMEGS